MQMLCPKCQNPMQQYERNGVVVDQCTGCRGIFLDRGELEHLLDAEEAFYAKRAAPAAVPPTAAPVPQSYDRRDDRRHDDRRYDDRRRHDDDHYYGDRRHGDGHYKKKKRKSVFEDLFDF